MKPTRRNERIARTISGRRSIVALAATIGAVTLCSLAASAEAHQGSGSGDPGVAYYAQGAKRGGLERLGADRYALTLRGVHRRITAFSGQATKPQRMKTGRFVGSWERLGFADRRPRAVLSLADARSGQSQLRFRLGQPRYRPQAKRVRYPARLTAGKPIARFGRARLLIDGQTAPRGGCEIKPFAQCAGADLHGRDLRGVNLSAADLTGADLSGANLSRASINNADLTGANLSGANLSGALLNRTKLSRAKLSNADLSKAVLGEADLFDADLPGADLSGAVLFKSNLRRANLPGATLSEANLSEANLNLAKLPKSNLQQADLSDSSLSQADLSGANLSRARLPGDDLTWSDLSEANLSGAGLSEANLSKANLSKANLSKANLSRAKLSGTNLSEAKLISANLSEAGLSGTKLYGADLSGANLSGAHIIDALFCHTIMPDGSRYDRDCRAPTALIIPVRLTVTGADKGPVSTIRTKAYEVQCASTDDPVFHTGEAFSRFKFGFTHDREHQCIRNESKLKYLFSITPEDGLTFEAMAVQIAQSDSGVPFDYRAKVIGCGRHVTCSAKADEGGGEIDLTIGL